MVWPIVARLPLWYSRHLTLVQCHVTHSGHFLVGTIRARCETETVGTDNRPAVHHVMRTDNGLVQIFTPAWIRVPAPILV